MFKSLLPLLVTTAAMCSILHAQTPGTDKADTRETEEKTKVATSGEEGPLFELKNQQGKTHKLANYKGKMVVLEWFNESYPFCEGVWGSGLVHNLINELNNKETEVVYLAMNSTANKPEEKIRESGTGFLEELKINIHMLMDYDGTVGHLYEAKTPPHMYVIDTEGILVYQGVPSDDARSKKGDKRKHTS